MILQIITVMKDDDSFITDNKQIYSYENSSYRIWHNG